MNRNVKSLLSVMDKHGIDAYIIPSSDSHISEYVADYWKGRAWVSGFTGSAGTLVISKAGNGLWTDGRYFIQAENQLDGSGVELFKMGLKDTPSISKWMKDKLEDGSTIGFSGDSTALMFSRKIEEECRDNHFKVISEFDLLEEVWNERPEIPRKSLFVLEEKYSGESLQKKIELVRGKLIENKANTYVIASLDDIAWMFNVRGNDVPNNPVTIAYAAITLDEAYIFIDKSKVNEEIKKYFLKNNVNIKAYDDVFKTIAEFDKDKVIYFNPSKINTKLYMAMPDGCKKIEGADITTDLKAIKNEVELENLRKCHLRDSAAMINFLHWIDTNVGKSEITEISADEKLFEFRKEQELFICRSFDSIAGYKEHAAMMHYKATIDNQYKLENKGLFLIDSGGQYYDGTTDITRTIVLGELSEEEKFHFTLVAKGHIALNNLKFLYGTTGSKLEMIARYPLWQHGIDYKCGTGHGVGFVLNVHEGPHGFTMRPNTIPFEKGMILTNEPGVYIQGKHGIRTENTMIVQEWKKTDSGQFMEFETISLVPIDLRGIDGALLSVEEKKWLNDYHKEVYDKVYPLVSDEVKKWLKNATKEI